MRKTMSLIMPVLAPSWRFFKTVEPSPRVQWVLLSSPNEIGTDWRAFRARPASLGPIAMLCRLFWNPAWNEALFLVSCAERIQQCPNDHSICEIQRRILSSPREHKIDTTDKWLQFRLIFVQRDGDKLCEQTVFTSAAVSTTDAARR